MNELTSKTESDLSPRARALILKYDIHVKVGDLVIANRGSIYKVLKVNSRFVDNLILRLPVEDKKKLESVIWESIEWWKRKVIWKRPLTNEDAKALRMIAWKVKKHFGLPTSRKGE